MKKPLRLEWLLYLLLSCSIAAFAHTHEMQETSPAVMQSDSLFNIEDTWTTSGEKPLQLHQLAGKPTVIAMIYTSCKDICPLVVEDMKRIERMLPESQRAKVNLAVFSFDSERDTPNRLKEYAKAHGIDSSPWILAHGNAAAVRRLAVALGMKYRKTQSGDFEHDTLITILDDAGVVRYRQNSLGKSMDEALRVLQKLM